jgi:hypothetical protein
MAQSKLMTSKKKRDNDLFLRGFQDQWEEQFLFTQTNSSKPICLVCLEVLAVVKKYNVEQHFQQVHKELNKKYPIGSSLRTEYISKQKAALSSQKNFFVKKKEEMTNMMTASYRISLLLAQKKRNFSDGEIVKECLSIFAKNTGNKGFNLQVENLALSRNTVMRRVEDMASDVSQQIIIASSLS